MLYPGAPPHESFRLCPTKLGWHACDKMAANRATNSKFRLCPYVGHKNKFRLGWHACDKMAANRATNSKFLFSGAFAPQFWGVLFLHPLF